jgi:hypothetical protein
MLENNLQPSRTSTKPSQQSNIRTLNDCRDEEVQTLITDIMTQLRTTTETVVDLEEKNEALETLLGESRQENKELILIIDKNNDTKKRWTEISEKLRRETDEIRNNRSVGKNYAKYYEEYKKKYW